MILSIQLEPPLMAARPTGLPLSLIPPAAAASTPPILEEAPALDLLCWEDAGDIAIDSAGNAYIVGGNEADDLPTTVGAYDTAMEVTMFTS